MSVDKEAARAATLALLEAIGEDPSRPGLMDTPDRVARFWAEFIDYDPGAIKRVFDGEQYEQMVVLRNVEGWSLCEHHLLPFSYVATIGYIPQGSVLGLSKLARLVYKHAHRLQIQERMVEGIADELSRVAETRDVAVYVRGTHTCAVMRGVRAGGAEFVTTALRGAFRESGTTRAEFLARCA